MDVLRSAVVDGRSENVRYRQNQLHQLHATLRNNASRICDAIAADTLSKSTAEVEFFLAMDSVKEAYATLDFDRMLNEEYFVAEGQDHVNRRVGHGLVAIRPAVHSRFYSAITPLSMAIATGNCVLLEIEESDSNIDLVLREILPKSLDRDSFAISSKKMTPSEVQEVDFFLNQADASSNRTTQDPAISHIRSIAVVDRSANIEKAAEDIVKSKLSPNCNSPYSPDLIIVNEFICEEFKAACGRWAVPGANEKITEVRKSSHDDDGLREAVERAKLEGQVKISKSVTSSLTIVEIEDRSCPLAVMKVRLPYLMIFPSTGIVDSIVSQKDLPPSIATYIYADPATAKSISEQLASAATYVNQIPLQILVGPISPAAQPHALHPRYTTATFSCPSPQFVVPVAPIIIDSSTEEEVRRKATEPLKPTGQPQGHALGFFEQGIVLGLGLVGFVVLPLVGTAVWFVGRKAWAMLR